MGTKLEELIVRLQADTAKYHADMMSAQKQTQTAMSGIRGSVSKAAAAYISFRVAVAAARTTMRMFFDTVRDVDKLAKQAKYLGISTEALAGLRLQSKLAGVEVGAMTMGLQRMTRAIGEASTGAGEYTEIFDRLGIRIHEILSLAPEKQMEMLAEGISKLPTQTEQASTAMEIFGRSGAQMLNILRQGSTGFRSAREEAKRFGTAISALDASKMEDLSDEITRANEAWAGFKIAATLAIGPVLEDQLKKSAIALDYFRATIVKYRKELGIADAGKAFAGGMERGRIARVGKEYEGSPWEGGGAVPPEEQARRAREQTDAVTAANKKASDARLMQMQLDLRTETEVLRDELYAQLDVRKAILDEAAMYDTTKAVEYNDLKVQLEKDVQDQLTQVAQEGIAARSQAALETRMQQVSAMSALGSILGSIGSMVDGSSRKAFEAQKKFAAASVVANTAAAIMGTLAYQAANPFKWVEVAAIAAAGVAQLASIQKSSYGGGGSLAGGNRGGGGGSGGPPQRVTNLSVIIEGEQVSADQARGLLAMVKSAVADGGTLVVT